MRLTPTESVEANIVPSGGFTIKASSKAFMLLSAGLYKNPIRAIVREICTNAIDAHIQAGKIDANFDVDLPTSYRAAFAVRDYGEGLSEEGIKEVFTVYFESTKAHSNEATGALGLGCKSPFGYTNTFSVISYYDGMKYVYSMYTIDHMPNYKLMTSEPSTEPSGLHVIVPVKQSDFQAFEREAWSVMPMLLTRPTVNGVPPDEAFKYVSRTVMAAGNFSAVSISKGTSLAGLSYYGVRMGGVVYPLDISILNTRTHESADLTDHDKQALRDLMMVLKFCHDAKSHTVIVEVPIGHVNFVPSREDLQLDRHTLKHLAQWSIGAVQAFKDEIDAFWTSGASARERLQALVEHPVFSKAGFQDDSHVVMRQMLPHIERAIGEINVDWRTKYGVTSRVVHVPMFDASNSTISFTVEGAAISLQGSNSRKNNNGKMYSAAVMVVPLTDGIERMHLSVHRHRVSFRDGTEQNQTFKVSSAIHMLRALDTRAFIDEHLHMATLTDNQLVTWVPKYNLREVSDAVNTIVSHAKAVAPQYRETHSLHYKFAEVAKRVTGAQLRDVLDKLISVITTDDGKGVIVQVSDWASTNHTRVWYNHSNATTRNTLKSLIRRHVLSIPSLATSSGLSIVLTTGATYEELFERANFAISNSFPSAKTELVFDIDQLRKDIKAMPRGPRQLIALKAYPIRVWDESWDGGRQIKMSTVGTVMPADETDPPDRYAAILDKSGVHAAAVLKTKINGKVVEWKATPCDLVRMVVAMKAMRKFAEGMKANQPTAYSAPKYRNELIFFTADTWASAQRKGLDLPLASDYFESEFEAFRTDPVLYKALQALGWTEHSSGDHKGLSSARHMCHMLSKVDAKSPLPTAFKSQRDEWAGNVAFADALRRSTSNTAAKLHKCGLPEMIVGKNCFGEMWPAWLKQYPLITYVTDTTMSLTTDAKHISMYLDAVIKSQTPEPQP